MIHILITPLPLAEMKRYCADDATPLRRHIAADSAKVVVQPLMFTVITHYNAYDIEATLPITMLRRYAA